MMIQYCRTGGSSKGVRAYLEKYLVPFAEANPQIQILVSTKRKHPFVMGWFERDNKKVLSLKNLSAEQCVERIQFLRDMRPIGMRKWAKPFRTTQSVQGEWELGQLLDAPHRTLRA